MSSHTLAKSAPPADPERSRDETLPVVVRRSRHGQWVAAVLVLVLLGLAVNSVVRNRAFQWDAVGEYFTSTAVLRGPWLTLWLTAVVMALGFALGTLLAASRLSTNPVLRSVSWGYVWPFRSIPILVQLLLWFNIGALYPQILGVRTVDLLGPVAIAIAIAIAIAVAVIGLTLHEAAYAIEGAERSMIKALRSVYSWQLGGLAAGHAVAGRGGVAVGQPGKRQPSLFGVLPSEGATW